MAPLPGSDAPLKRETIFDDTMWIVYCCCEGWGIGKFGDPLIGAESKQLCLRSSVMTTDIMGEDGLCNQVGVTCCITQQCQLPPVQEAPVCACFNKKFGGSFGSTSWYSKSMFDKAKIMDETFWIMYFICEGCGINKMDQGLYSNEFKELCCRGSTNIEGLVTEGVFCGSVGTELCIWSECQMPPAQGNPKIAFCTWRLNKEKSGAPAQIEIM